MNQELVDYIKQQKNLNVSKSKITDVLLGQGWHQSELDEAFLSAEGMPSTIKFSRNETAGSQPDDFNVAGEGQNPNRKTIIMIASGLVVVAVLAGIAILSFSGIKKNNPEVVANQNPEQTENAGNPNSNDASTTAVGTANTAAADAQKAVLAAAAKDLAGTITAPQGWTARQGIMQSRPLAAFFKPGNDKENISITRESLKASGVANLDEYVAKSKSALQTTISGYKITADRKVNLADGTPAVLLGGAFTQGTTNLKNTQLFAVNGDNIYIVTAVAPAADWDKEKDMLGTAVMSFKFPG